MDVFEAIKKRRSIRNYKPDPIPDEFIEKVIDAARWAPSAHNAQPWEFIIIKDKELLRRLSKTHVYSGFLKDSPLAIAACVDQNKSPNHFVEDCSAAIQNLLLAATALGLGTCWIAVYRHEDDKSEVYVREVLSIPENFRVIALISIGYPAHAPAPPGRVDLKNLIHVNRF
ncbi:MAG: nitroreductase family protein [Candidatus Bathyarchaeia archaeon]